MSLKLALCLFVLALVICAQGAEHILLATVGRNPINVGQTTVVRLTGGQLDVAGGNSIESFGTEFAQAVEITKIDRNKFQVKGLAACDCVLKFSDGKNETTVKLRVVKK